MVAVDFQSTEERPKHPASRSDACQPPDAASAHFQSSLKANQRARVLFLARDSSASFTLKAASFSTNLASPMPRSRSA